MQAASCARCGRVYRTTAPQPMNQTQVVTPPPQVPPWVQAFTLHLSKLQSNPRAVKVAIAAAALLLLTSLSWKAFTTLGGRDVLLFENGAGVTGGIPIATQDANDLFLWNRTMAFMHMATRHGLSAEDAMAKAQALGFDCNSEPQLKAFFEQYVDAHNGKGA